MTTGLVVSLDGEWLLPVIEVIDYSSNGWVYVRTIRGRYFAHRDEITIYPQETRP